jgi:hypothetical protein
MMIEGEPVKRFKIYWADAQNNSVGKALVEYDTEPEVLAHKRRADWHYVIYEQRKPVTRAKLSARIWKCPLCEQTVITRPGSQPILPSGYFRQLQAQERHGGRRMPCAPRF